MVCRAMWGSLFTRRCRLSFGFRSALLVAALALACGSASAVTAAVSASEARSSVQSGCAGVNVQGTPDRGAVSNHAPHGTPVPISSPAGSPVAASNSTPASVPCGIATVREALNLRAGPSTQDAVLLVMPAGATVALTGKAANGSVSVGYQGRHGWAASAYLNKRGPAGEERWIDVARGAGRVTLYEGDNARVTYRGFMSADRSDDGFWATALGAYRVYAMNADLTYTEYGDVYIRDWVGFDPDRANGFHSYPMDEVGTVLPDAAGPSHGCVRLAPGDADALYAFASLGTRVVVHW